MAYTLSGQRAVMATALAVAGGLKLVPAGTNRTRSQSPGDFGSPARGLQEEGVSAMRRTSSSPVGRSRQALA